MVLNDSFYLMVGNSYCKLLMHTNSVFVAYFEGESWQIKPAWNCYQMERILSINFIIRVPQRYFSFLLLKIFKLGTIIIESFTIHNTIYSKHYKYQSIKIISSIYFQTLLILGTMFCLATQVKTNDYLMRQKWLGKLSFALYKFLILGKWHFFWFMLSWLAAFTSKRTTLKITHTYNCDICVSEIRTNLNGAYKLIIFVANSAFLLFYITNAERNRKCKKGNLML